ncbi:MAG: ankyrin repeat domain-containing protein [Endomicrobium sp.]|nr:ankyrin repeat domain-containing protein [Endomicrobium sp.]
MKKRYLLFSFIFPAALAGCVARTVIAHNPAPIYPQPVYAETIIVSEYETNVVPVSAQKAQPNRKRATTPLIYAVSINNLDGVQYLLNSGENANEIFYSASYEAAPLQEAVKRANLNAAQILVRGGANIDLRVNDKTALEMAVRKNDFEMVNLLVSNRADIYSPNILEDSVKEYDTNILKYLLDNGAANRNVPSARRGADYALIKACKLGNIEAIRLLIKAGADVSVIDARGRGLLFYAASRNDVAVLEFIYPYNKRMLNSIDDDGFTPLMVAVERGNIHGVRFLVGKGAYLDVKNKHSYNAVHYSKNAELTKFLNEETPKHKKPAGYAMRREATSKYDDHTKNEKVKTAPQQKHEQIKPEIKPSGKPHTGIEVDSSVRPPHKIERAKPDKQIKPEPTEHAKPVEQDKANKRTRPAEPEAKADEQTFGRGNSEANPEINAEEKTNKNKNRRKNRIINSDEKTEASQKQPAVLGVDSEHKKQDPVQPKDFEKPQTSPVEQAKPAEQIKSNEQAKPAQAARPQSSIPAAQTKSNEQAKPASRHSSLTAAETAPQQQQIKPDPKPAATRQAKPVEQAKPAEQVKSNEQAKPAQAARPQSSIPAAQTKSNEQAAPAQAAKPETETKKEEKRSAAQSKAKRNK